MEKGKQTSYTHVICFVTSYPFLISQKIPYTILDEWGKKLGAHPDKWALVGSMLGLMNTVSIYHHRQYPYKNGNGELVLIKWQESNLPHTDLIKALRSHQVVMFELALSIEEFYGQ